MSDAISHAGRKPYYSPKWLAFRISQFLLILGVLWAWLQYVNATPVIPAPVATLPSPNGYDFFVKATDAWIEPAPHTDLFFDARRIPRKDWPSTYPREARRQWLQSNAQAFQLIQQGLKYPCVLPAPNPEKQNLRMWSPRNIVLALRSRANLQFIDGQWGRASATLLDAIEISYAVRNGGGLRDYLAGMGNGYGLDRDLAEVIPHLSSTQANAARQRLDAILARAQSLPETLRKEKAFVQAQALNDMRSGEWTRRNGDLAQRNSWLSLKEYLRVSMIPKRASMKSITLHWNEQIQQARLPYYKRTAAVSPTTQPADIYHTNATNFFWHTRSQTADQFLLLQLALQGYHATHKKYPASLNQLIPQNLNRLLPDPFGRGRPLRYHLINGGRKYLLYSVGPDGKDDGGQPASRRRGNEIKYYTEPTSTGDFVAGINS